MTLSSLRTDALLIAGPTASGKSALAQRLAEALGGTVINADSMQVYKDLSVLTARPGPEEHRRAPHRLFGHVDGAQAYSVAQWLTDARAVLETCVRPAIFVGGTGLYFQALTEGLAQVPNIPASIRAEVRALADTQGIEALRAARLALDADETDMPEDAQRLARQLEVLRTTGWPLRDFYADKEPPVLEGLPWQGWVVDLPREALYTRCDTRFLQMMETGAPAEVEALLKRRLSPNKPVMKALGVAPLAAWMRGDMTKADAIALAQRDTRRYAKRQLTWARHRMEHWPRVAPDTAFQTIMESL